MKAIIQFYNQPAYAKLVHWGKLITITGGTQTIVQATGLLSGILVIRLLSTSEYALYTIANTMLGTMTVLADGGISSGVMAQGGKKWNDRQQLGIILATGLDLRKKFSVISLIVIIPILIYLLLHQNAEWVTILLILGAIIPSFFAALSDSLLEIAPKLHQDIKPLQSNQLIVSLNRLFLTGVSLFFFPFTAIAILASGVPRVLGNIRLKKIANKYADFSQIPDKTVSVKILKIVKKILPGSIYYCLSGQITIWLISIFGDKLSIAQIGALGRLSIVLNIVSISFGVLIMPRFARLPNEKEILLFKFIQIMFSVSIICITGIAIVWLSSKYILFILGRSYYGLDNELVMNIIVGALNLISGICFGLSVCRGWVINPYLLIIGNLLSIVVGALLFNITTLSGVLYFSMFVSIVPVILNGGFCMHKILNLTNNNNQ